jgi:AcrR family transcriptional regulator
VRPARRQIVPAGTLDPRTALGLDELMKSISQRSASAQSNRARPLKRRRRLPEMAEQEILGATEKLLRRLPFHKLTVGAIMAETGLSRPSFYQYFEGVYQILGRLTEQYIADLLAPADVEAGQLSIRESIVRRDVYQEGCRLIHKRRHLHRALVNASPNDPTVERIHRRYMDAMARVLEGQIRTAQAQGYAKGLEPVSVARALQLMSEYYIFEKLVMKPRGDPRQVADTLATLVERVIFGEVPGEADMLIQGTI